MGPRARNDNTSSNSSASVRSSNHGNNEQPKTRIGMYRRTPYYILDKEGFPYDPRAEIAELFIKNLPPLDMHFRRWKGVDQPKEVWMLLYHVRSLFRRLSQEQAAMYIPSYGWFKPQSDPDFQDLYAGPHWEIPSELKYICPVTPPAVPKSPLPRLKTPGPSSSKLSPVPHVLDSSSSREVTPASAGPSACGPSVRFPSPVGPQQRWPIPPVASGIAATRGKPMLGSKATEVPEETSRSTSRRTVKQITALPNVKPNIAPAKGPAVRSKKNPTAQPSSIVEPPAHSDHFEDEPAAPSLSKGFVQSNSLTVFLTIFHGKSTAKGKSAFKSASVIEDSESDAAPRQAPSKKRKFQESEGESEAPTPEKGKGKKPACSKKKPKGSCIEGSVSYAPELKSDTEFDQTQKPEPAPGYLGFFDKPLSPHPRTQPQIDALPKDEQWFFNPKANTQNSFIRAPDESTPNVPLGHPWWPSLIAKYHATNGPPVKDKEMRWLTGVQRDSIEGSSSAISSSFKR
ncbi:hypothetical protein B0H13DRAFT_2385203 [Mycena leptocephala]|nr:hypothetical protein B0H13DRAFT_2385203 [Mycena leptocephala]